VIERGIFNYKKVIDGRKQYNLWLCWLPKAPTPRPVPASEIDTPVPRKKASKKDITIKQEDQQEVKQEDKEEPNELSSPRTPTPVMTLLRLTATYVHGSRRKRKGRACLGALANKEGSDEVPGASEVA